MDLDPEEQFLHDARNGNIEKVRKLLDSRRPGETNININCKGKSKSNLGWTPLHLACYFGHKHVVEELLKAGAEVNVLNDMGDTPLHRAAYTGRKELVMLLLQYHAFSTIKNGTAQTPKEVTQDKEIQSMLEAAERTEERKLEELLLAAVREGQTSTLTELGVNRTLQKFEGPVWKSSRFFGWRLYWVVLQDGVLSWYPKQSDAAANKHRQGCKHLTQAVCTVRSLRLEQEQEKSKILSEALQTLATEHHELEQSVVKRSPSQSVLSEDEFYDAVSDSDSEHSLSGFETVTSHSFDEEPVGYSSSGRSSQTRMANNHGNEQPQSNGIKKRRTSLPAPMFSRNDFSVWSILKKCIGMELSKITMPVIFNEPLSFLQRLTEYMEHTYLIHQASASSNSIERMQCVAAFAVSAVAGQWERTGKPFNPLLGETYELVREDLGFRLISEQVSHHPPISAFHAEGLEKDFVFHGSIYPKLKFWGKSVEAEPKGVITLELSKHNESYTWTNPTCCVHNIIVGKLWIEQYGNVEIINHETGEKCCLNFKPCGLFGKELHKVEGYIVDKRHLKRYDPLLHPVTSRVVTGTESKAQK
ncbi:UNVERIFIED_CONTAM: hypothetical protein FKN15_024763 [Acipenser sinensis]